MARRYFSSTSVRTTLTAGINGSETVITVGSVSGFPATRPYTLLLDFDGVSEEIVTVTDATGTTLVVTRGVDGTSGVSHTAGAVVVHGFTARDLDEPNAHIQASSSVHGVAGAVVGTTDTQTLTNKTIDFDVNTLLNVPLGPTGPAGAAGAAGADGADGLGVPAGGTAGQVLAKIDAVDNNTEWVDQSGGGGGAVGGGTDAVFYENDTNVTTSYTITSGKNAVTAGPVTIDSGATVTVPSGSSWVVV